ncbi:hypothetical protein AB0K48_45620, partial [Nonomuraea sp. NPDC055795]
NNCIYRTDKLRISMKGLSLRSSGLIAWKKPEGGGTVRLIEFNIAKHRVWSQVYMTTKYRAKYASSAFIKNMKLKNTVALCADTFIEGGSPRNSAGICGPNGIRISLLGIWWSSVENRYAASMES